MENYQGETIGAILLGYLESGALKYKISLSATKNGGFLIWMKFKSKCRFLKMASYFW